MTEKNQKATVLQHFQRVYGRVGQQQLQADQRFDLQQQNGAIAPDVNAEARCAHSALTSTAGGQRGTSLSMSNTPGISLRRKNTPLSSIPDICLTLG